jgi:hypothetical protein
MSDEKQGTGKKGRKIKVGLKKRGRIRGKRK